MDSGLYQTHLDRVSRSFAFCIAQLAPPMRDRVALSYLMCRLVDTVEDAPWAAAGDRATAFCDLDAIVASCAEGQPPADAAVGLWAASLPAAIPAGERALADIAPTLCDHLAALPADARAPICATVRQMGAGMAHFSGRPSPARGLALTDLADVNRYCYFVAGTVGQLLTHLFALHWPRFRAPLTLMKDAFHFGLFLQKINILKDQAADERQGRFLVPDRAQLLRSAPANARGALRYLSALPAGADGFRIFCAWSLFLGAACLPLLAGAGAGGPPARLPRARTLALLAEVAAIADDDASLARRLEAALTSLPASTAVPPAAARAPRELGWFRERVASFLEPALGGVELAELQMV